MRHPPDIQPERRTLVVIHGFTGRPQNWDPVLKRTSRNAVRIHVPGHGIPADPSSGFAGALRAIRAQIPEELFETGFDLAGYSLGGRLALGLAVEHPEGIRQLLLVGAHPGLERPAARTRRITEDEQLAQRLESDGLLAFMAEWRARPLFASQARLPERARKERDFQTRLNTAAGLAASLRQAGLGQMPCYLGWLGDLLIPTTLVVGALDPKFRALAESMASRIPRAKLVVARGVGHDVVLEDPQLIARLLEHHVATPGVSTLT